MLDNFVHFLTKLDYKVWALLNNRWHDPLFDYIIPYFRNQWFWTPLYFFLALYMPTVFKKKGWLWCLFFLISFIISDQISAGWLKPHFHRLRPCNREDLAQVIHLIVNCGGQYGFPSSHAANHFSIGIFSAMTLGSHYRWVWPAAITWALLVCYAQVYVGVHFPLDVACGGMIGVGTGIITGAVFNRFFPIYNRHGMPLSA